MPASQVLRGVAARASWAMAVAAVVTLTGCATLSEQECKTADWGRLGYQDGAAGHSESRLASHAEACQKIGIRPNAQLWRAGWDQGVLTYCTPRVGWREGLAGRGYEGVCRGRNEDAFLHAFNLGTDIHRLQARIDSNARDINRLERQLHEARHDDVRRELRQRIRSLDFEQSRLRSSLTMLQSSAPRF